MSAVRIHMPRGGTTLVDPDVAASLPSKVQLGAGGKYPVLTCGSKKVYLHRYILNARSDQFVDHINGNKLDNRRANLRFATSSENQLNRHHCPHGVSAYRGVYRSTRSGTWGLKIMVRGKMLYFASTWHSAHVAACFMDTQLRTIVGPFVTKNFPRTIPSNRICRFIAETKGRIFTVVFSRRTDGTQRIMTCRTGVTSRAKGGASSFCPCLRALALVWDVHKRDYRTIPVERVVAIRFGKVNYRIEGNHEDMYAQTGRAT